MFDCGFRLKSFLPQIVNGRVVKCLVAKMRPTYLAFPNFCRGRFLRLTETFSIIAHHVEKVNTFFEDFLRILRLIVVVPFLGTAAEELDETVFGAFRGGFVYYI